MRISSGGITNAIDLESARPNRSMPLARKLMLLTAVAAGLVYPFILRAFHIAISRHSGGIGGIRRGMALLAAFAVPVLSFVWAIRLSSIVTPTHFELRARRLAFAGVAAPPLFVFAGVSLGLLGKPITDLTAWIAGWLAAALYGLSADNKPADTWAGSVSRLRVIHGVSAALLCFFLLFHLGNHLTGLIGPDMHARVMAAGRTVYRSHIVEPLLTGLLLFQVATGLRLAWRWSATPADLYRAVQIGSGIYLGTFIITHLNSALISARLVHKIPTNWAWASGAPTGLIHDAWNIRLLPHYAFGAFFLLAHLCTALRLVLLEHGFALPLLNRIWRTGLVASAAIAFAIVCGLCGVRV